MGRLANVTVVQQQRVLKQGRWEISKFLLLILCRMVKQKKKQGFSKIRTRFSLRPGIYITFLKYYTADFIQHGMFDFLF